MRTLKKTGLEEFQCLLVYVILAGHTLLFEIVHVDIPCLVLPDLQAAIGPRPGIREQVNNRLVVDFDEGYLENLGL